MLYVTILLKLYDFSNTINIYVVASVPNTKGEGIYLPIKL